MCNVTCARVFANRGWLIVIVWHKSDAHFSCFSVFFFLRGVSRSTSRPLKKSLHRIDHYPARDPGLLLISRILSDNRIRTTATTIAATNERKKKSQKTIIIFHGIKSGSERTERSMTATPCTNCKTLFSICFSCWMIYCWHHQDHWSSRGNVGGAGGSSVWWCLQFDDYKFILRKTTLITGFAQRATMKTENGGEKRSEKQKHRVTRMVLRITHVHASESSTYVYEMAMRFTSINASTTR